jgi:hypothetical protein
MKTRNGKIARLPKEVREQLNRRLENGWRGTRLIKWLNDLPEVREVLREEFHGHAISAQNLSQWREGGYADWLRHQDSREGMRWILERAEDLEEEPGEENFCERLARIVTVEVATQVQRLDKIEDPKERWRELREVCLELWRLRNATSYGQSVALGWKQWQRKVGQEEAAQIQEPAEGEQSQEEYLESLMDQMHIPEIREWVRTDWPNREAEFLRLKEIYDLKPDSKDTPFHPSQESREGLRRSAVYKFKVNQSESQ